MVVPRFLPEADTPAHWVFLPARSFTFQRRQQLVLVHPHSSDWGRYTLLHTYPRAGSSHFYNSNCSTRVATHTTHGPMPPPRRPHGATSAKRCPFIERCPERCPFIERCPERCPFIKRCPERCPERCPFIEWCPFIKRRPERCPFIESREVPVHRGVPVHQEVPVGHREEDEDDAQTSPSGANTRRASKNTRRHVRRC